jgi:hypothetical protein
VLALVTDHDGRVDLALSTAATVATMLPQLRSPRGLQVLNEFAMRIARDEELGAL